MKRRIDNIARLGLCLLIVSLSAAAGDAENSLAVIDGGVQRSEDAPYVRRDFQFFPGDYVYFTFHVAGFAATANQNTETKSLSLSYEITPQDERHVAVTASASGEIKGELGSEDKNWTPKRRVSFLLPSYVAAGEFLIHVMVKDLLAKTETSRDYPFEMGGVHAGAATAIQVENFDFLRHEEDADALELPAYAPGDTVWARFQMIGFKTEAENKYRLSYGIKVVRPDGKAFLDEPKAAQIAASSFYPAQFVPGELQITTPKDAQPGSYQLTLTVRDLVSDQSFDLKRTFTIE